ncbi:MAG: Sec-independent protein translocase protein TatB [Sphingosinicella sp.]
MFGIDSGEILVIAVVALVVIGPRDLPRAMRAIGNFIGQARGMARHFRSGFDAMVREVELEEMEKKWRTENERIMAEHPALPDAPAAATSAGAAPPIPPTGVTPAAPEARPKTGRAKRR